MTKIIDAQGVASVVVSVEPCKVKSIKGNWRGGADAYLMILDSGNKTGAGGKGTLTGELTILGQVQVYANSPFSWDFPEMVETLHGCIVGISTSATAWSAAAASGDFIVEGEGFEATATTTEIGDAATTETLFLNVWTNVGDKLLRLEVVNDSASDRYAMVFGKAAGSINEGDFPTLALSVPAGASKTFEFGGGLIPIPASNRTCSVIFSAVAVGTLLGEAGAAMRFVDPGDTTYHIRARFAAI